MGRWLLKGGAAVASQLYLLVASGTLEPRVASHGLPTEARNGYFNVKSDFK